MVAEPIPYPYTIYMTGNNGPWLLLVFLCPPPPSSVKHPLHLQDPLASPHLPNNSYALHTLGCNAYGLQYPTSWHLFRGTYFVWYPLVTPTLQVL